MDKQLQELELCGCLPPADELLFIAHSCYAFHATYSNPEVWIFFAYMLMNVLQGMIKWQDTICNMWKSVFTMENLLFSTGGWCI